MSATLLREAGIETEVLEARDRVGGRAWTTYTKEGAGVDLGGQWLGEPQERIVHWARELGISTIPAPGNGMQLSVDGNIYSRPESEEILSAALAQAASVVDSVKDSLNRVNRPWQIQDAELLDQISVEEWLRTGITGALHQRVAERVITSDLSSLLSEVSALAFADATAATGGLSSLMDGTAESRIFAHGSSDIPRALAQRLGTRVHLSHTVTSIRELFVAHERDLPEYDDSFQTEGEVKGIEVQGPWGSMTADWVILAIPPTLAAEILRKPQLPGLQHSATEVCMRSRMNPGAVIKAIAVYDSPFWIDEELSAEWILLGHRGVISMIMDVSRGGQGMLATLITGDDYKRAATLSDTQLRDEITQGLAEVLGETAKSPQELHLHNWYEDPLTASGYGQLPSLGLLTSRRANLAEPVGRVHFAGTETAREWTGFFEGAIRSGERAARAIIAEVKSF